MAERVADGHGYGAERVGVSLETKAFPAAILEILYTR